jgi:mono/diheme cytochrome c family protein
MRTTRLDLLLCGALLSAALFVAAPRGVAGQAPLATYESAQAEAGAEAYRANCAACHMVDLSGGVEGPPLAGEYFASMWGGRPVTELLTFVRNNMPLTRRGSLDEQTTLALIAYLLAKNGAPAGEVPLAAGSEGVIPPAR